LSIFWFYTRTSRWESGRESICGNRISSPNFYLYY